MVTQKITYYTKPKERLEYLSSDQVAASREEAVEEAKRICDAACTLGAWLGDYGQDLLSIKCDSREYDSYEAAETQESFCRAAGRAVISSVNGQAALVRGERRIDS